MKTDLFKVLAACFCAASMSCSGSGEKATYLNADVNEIASDLKGGSQTINLQCDANSFVIEHTPDWIKAELNGSQLKVDLSPNESGAVKNDSVVISCAGMRLLIPVSQTAIDPTKYAHIEEAFKQSVSKHSMSPIMKLSEVKSMMRKNFAGQVLLSSRGEMYDWSTRYESSDDGRFLFVGAEYDCYINIYCFDCEERQLYVMQVTPNYEGRDYLKDYSLEGGGIPEPARPAMLSMAQNLGYR